MRYAESGYGEQPIAIGIFATGDTVTIQVLDLSTDSLLSITPPANQCSESAQIPGFFYWSASNLDTPYPTDFKQLLYVMSNASGRQHAGKLVLGGYPSDSAKRRFQQAVWINTATGASGQTFDIGTPENPVDNLTDARAIANREGLSTYEVRGPLTISTNHENWKINGVQPLTDIITVNVGVSVNGTAFERVGIQGDLTGMLSGGAITAKECLIGAAGSTTKGIAGVFTTCGFDGTIQPLPYPSIVQGIDLSSQSQSVSSPTCLLDYNNQWCVWIAEIKGIWTVKNVGGPFGDFSVLAYSLAGARVTLENTVSKGTFIFLGYGELIDNKVGAGYFLDNIIKGSRIDVSTSTRATQAQILSDATPFAGADVASILDILEATSEVDQTTDPWTEKWIRQSDLSLLATFELYDETLTAINNSNPITGKHVRRRLKV